MKLSTAFVLLAAVLTAQAQTVVSTPDRVVSPELSGTQVTFRIYAPKAEVVTINGDWMKLGERASLARGADGVWSITLGPLAPNVYLYSFAVDGMTVADPVNPRLKLRARTSASLLEVPGDAPWLHKRVPHGKVEMITHHSSVLGDVREVYVYTPPAYDANRGKRYPVLYLLHGSNDVAAGWTATGRAHVILDNLIATGKAEPMLVVMPWAHAAPFGAPGQQNTELFERYLLEDVMPMVDTGYRIIKQPSMRALAGLSMGASHSLHIGLRHPKLFGNLGIFSMGGLPRGFEETYKSALDFPNQFNSSKKVFWIAIGTEDEGLTRNRELRTLLRKRGIQFTESEGAGGHFYPVFRRELTEFVPMLFRR